MTRPLRVLVTGQNGQVVTALAERAPEGVDVLTLGRPELDLADPASIRRAFEGRLKHIAHGDDVFRGDVAEV